MSKLYRCAVVGNPIAHSLSPMIHQQFAKQFLINLCYEKILAEEHSFKQVVYDFFRQGGTGLNITSPFKRMALDLANTKTAAAIDAGCTNTLWYEGDKLVADCTDSKGFEEALKTFGDCQKKSWLILGAGDVVGALLPVIKALTPESITIANRSLHKAESYQRRYHDILVTSLDKISGRPDIIINATAIDFKVNPQKAIEECFENSYCMDLNYSDKPTSFIKLANNHGAIKTIDGFQMLNHQGALSFFRWFGKKPDALAYTQVAWV